ncbi:anaerobic carbon-monoxide dehydrogenase catalytic subunit [Thermococcus sp.]
MKKYKEVSIDSTTQQMYERAQELGIETVWERLEKQQPQCGYGLLGVCCRNCMMGPCRINPFGGEPRRGVCGADADTIVARNLLRMIAAGAAAHSDHGRHVALTLLIAAEMAEKFKKEGKPVLELDNMASSTLPYRVKDVEKLKAVAKKLGIEIEGKTIRELAKEVAEIALRDFGKQDEEALSFLKAYLNPKTYEIFEKAPEKAGMPWFENGILPRGIDREIVESLHRTHMGTDHDPVSILLHGLKTSLGDAWGGSLIATELQDILFGTPQVIKAEANLGVLKEDYVNIVVHGHEPVLSEKIVEAAQDPELIELAQKLGAKGINVVGMCCTGLEVLMRHGIPIAGNFLQQEMAIVTGAVEAMVVDVQCIMPATVDVARCFHTKIIDTSPIATFPGAIHIKFDERRADEIAKEIVKTAVENFPNRSKKRVEIPKEKMSGYVGFSVEAILKHFGGSLKPIEEAIVEGKIKGVAGLVGCNNPKIKQDHNHIKIANELMKRDVLLIGTGCWATAAMKHGIFLPEYADTDNVGPGLREFAKEWGIPPAINMGSCVDCTRMLVLADLIARDIGVPISALPVVGSAPEAMTEKAVSIGTYFVASGITTHLGIVPPVLGSPAVVKILTHDLYDIVGAAFIVEPDPYKAAKLMYEHIMKKRKELGI